MPFALSVNKFIDDALEGVRDVRNNAAIALINDASTPNTEGGRMPVDTGTLRDSINVNNVSGLSTVVATVRGTPINGTITIGWDAPYAVAVEFGGNGRAPAAFARTALTKWDMYVRQAADKEYRRA